MSEQGFRPKTETAQEQEPEVTVEMCTALSIDATPEDIARLSLEEQTVILKMYKNCAILQKRIQERRPAEQGGTSEIAGGDSSNLAEAANAEQQEYPIVTFSVGGDSWRSTKSDMYLEIESDTAGLGEKLEALGLAGWGSQSLSNQEVSRLVELLNNPGMQQRIHTLHFRKEGIDRKIRDAGVENIDDIYFPSMPGVELGDLDSSTANRDFTSKLLQLREDIQALRTEINGKLTDGYYGTEYVG